MISFGIKDIIDILIVAVLLYNIYRMMKDSGTINVFTGVLAFIGVWIVVTQGAIMDKFMSIGLLVLVILFQDQIRRFLVELGSHRRWQFFLQMFRKKTQEDESPYVMQIVHACMSMSKVKTGALIVIANDMPLTAYENTGDIINADINSRLIENIFFKNSPLHDGAMIIVNNRIRAAGCILPVSHNNDIPRSLGLRHRSALGITQETDATAIIVSEETGNISVARNGKLHLKLTGKDLEQLLRKK